MRDLEFERKFYTRLFAGVGLAFIIGVLTVFFGIELLIIEKFWSTSPGIFWTCQGLWAMVLSVVLATIFKLGQNKSG